MNIITTHKKWDDVLPHASVQALTKILDGCRHKKETPPGHPAQALPCLVLFYGASRENKIAAAALMAAQLDQQAYRVDLQAIVSKYIGETEKNLAAVFDKAEKKDWVLFFDEADALFGKRTEVRDSHDKYANQINYLLQRIEKYQGLVILATSNKTDLSSYLLRHFHSVIHFPDQDKI